MSFKDLKQKLNTLKPFVVYEFFGQSNCLARPNPNIENEPDIPLIPLNVSTTPPSMTVIIESELITTLILRYSDTYQKSAKKNLADLSNDAKTEVAKKIMEEMSSKMLGDETERLQQITTLTRLGKEFMQKKAIEAWYGDYDDPEAEKIKVFFVDTQQEVVEGNNKSDDLYIWTESLNDMDYLRISMKLMDAMPQDEIPANIPIVEVTEGGIIPVVEGGETETVPADKVARFPRKTRNIAVEAVSGADS